MRKSRSKGQIAVVYAAAIAGLCAALALGTDVAVMFVNWQQVRKTADAAAVAGATYLTGLSLPSSAVDSTCTAEKDDAQKAACTYAVKNGLTASQVTMSEPTSTTIQVTASETGLPYDFGQVFGLSTYSVAATAVAQGPGNIGTVTIGLFPVGLQCTQPCNLSDLNPGYPVSFGAKFVNGLAPGNWQFMAPDSQGASELGTALQDGATGSFSVLNPDGTCPSGSSCTISTETGNQSNSVNVKDGLAARLNSCPPISEPCSGSNPTNIPLNDPCLVVVPAVDFHHVNGNKTLNIEGFALIYIDPTTTTTNNINGCFVSTVTSGTIASATAPGLGGLVPDTLIQ
jgi:hypothetical protein